MQIAALRQLPFSFYYTLVCVFFVSLGNFLIVPFFSIYFTSVVKIPIYLVGFALALQIFSQRAFSIVGGILTDYFSPKKIIILGLLFCGLAYIGFSLVHYAFELLLCSFCLGLANSLLLPSSKAALLLMSNNILERPVVFSLRSTVMNIGVSIGPLLGALTFKISQAPVFFVTSMVYLGLVIFSFLFIKNIPTACPVDSTEKYNKSMLFHSDVVKTFFLSTLFMIGFMQMDLTMPLFVKNFSSTFGVGYIFMLNAIIVLCLSLPFSIFLINEGNVKILIYVAIIFLIICYSILSLSHHFLIILFGTVFLSFSEIAFFPAADTLITRRFPPHLMGTSLGFVQIGYTVGGVIATSAGGYLYEKISKTGDPHLYWMLLTAVLFVGMMMVFVSQLILKKKNNYFARQQSR